MPDNSAAIVIDIGTTNCKVTCFSCLDATTLGAHKFVTAKQISHRAMSISISTPSGRRSARR